MFFKAFKFLLLEVETYRNRLNYLSSNSGGKFIIITFQGFC